MGSATRSTRRWWWGGSVALTHLLVALAATWPLAARFTTAIPRGIEQEATVPVFSLWTLWWTADRATHGFAGYWDAPFFHPQRGVFTFSEPQILLGLLVAPLWWLGAPPAMAYNVALVLALSLNGLCTHRLARALGVPRPAALSAGWLAVTVPFVARSLGVLPVIPVFGVCWVLEGFVRFTRSGAARHAAWAAAGFVALYLSSQQLALVFTPFAILVGLFALADLEANRRALVTAGVAVAVVGLMLLPIAWPVQKIHAELGFRRGPALVQALSARPVDFLTRPATALVPFPPRADTAAGDTAGLFPGFILLALGAAGAVAGIRAGGAARQWALCLGGIALGAAVLALGLNVSLAGWHPFNGLRLLVPGFDRLRSPFRFAAIAQLALAALAAFGLAWAGRLAPRALRVPLIVALGLLGAAENLSVPGPLVAMPSTPRTAWTAWLRTQPPGTVVAHVPMAAGGHVADYEPEAWRQFRQIDHGKPLVNGYASYFPSGYLRFQLDVNRYFPAPSLLCFLGGDTLKVNALVVDQAWLAAHPSAVETPAVRRLLEPVYTDADVAIYRLTARPEDCGPATPR